MIEQIMSMLLAASIIGNLIGWFLYLEVSKLKDEWRREALDATERATRHFNNYLDVAARDFAIRLEADRWKAKYIARMRNSVPRERQHETPVTPQQ